MSHYINIEKIKKKVGGDLSVEIGKKIKVLRKTKRMAQQDLADALDVKRATISNYEIGKRSPSIKELERIANVLGASLEYFGVGSADINDLIARAKYVTFYFKF